MKDKLAYIKSHVGSISPVIAQLQGKEMVLVDSGALVKNIELNMDSGLDEVAKMVPSKLNSVLKGGKG